MLKKSPSRNHRNKGIRVKHVLQIAMLLVVCFWLLYQLKHSYDKKAVLDETAADASIRSLSDGELLKLGRKDLHHKNVSKDVKQEEEEEEHAVGDKEEDKKHEAQEREDEDPKEKDEDIEEEEENKNEDTQVEGRAGDDEVDELERREGKVEEDNLDEEKENEDEGDEKDGGRNESEEREGQEENQNSSDDQDKDGGDQNTQEAREEHYKGDDASSAVTHDAQVISTESKKVSLESANENSGSSTLEKEIKSNYTEDVKGNSLRLFDGRATENETVSVAVSEKKVDENLSNPVDSSFVNGTMKVQSDEILEADNNLTIVSTEAINNLLEVNQENGTETVSMSVHSTNATLDGMTAREGIAGESLVVEQTNNTTSANFHSDSNSTVSSNMEENNVSKMILRSNGTAQAVHDSRSLTINESAEVTKNEETKTKDANKSEVPKNEAATKYKESTDTGESDRTGDNSGSRNGTEYAVWHDPTDSSDSLVSIDTKEAPTDALPEMKTVGDENGQAAAE